MRSAIKTAAAVLLIAGLLHTPVSSFTLYDPGSAEIIIDYERYGNFSGRGTENYRYQVTRVRELGNAVGQGIFPNTWSIKNDPLYQRAVERGQLDGHHWDFVHGKPLRLAFYKWVTAPEDPGVRLFYSADILERAGLIEHAIKAYYTILVHFPRAIGWTFYDTPWHIGPAAIDRIHYLTRNNPHLGVKLEGAYIRVENRYDNNPRTDVFTIDPGRLVEGDAAPRRVNIASLRPIRRLGGDSVGIVQYDNGSWQIKVNGVPKLVKAMAYQPIKVGKSPDDGTAVVHRDWMLDDHNNSGLVDGPYEAWVDRRRNNRKDPEDEVVGDLQLMKDMGVNALRLYHHAYNDDLLMDMYENYGMMFLMGDFLGMYAVGSGADWYEGTDYTNETHKQNMLDSVRSMVESYRDKPYILMWVLGNENNYGAVPQSGCLAGEQPDEFYQFVNEAALLIKELDPYNRPVAISNGELHNIHYFKKHCPDVDVFGANVYRGKHGFGTTFWKDVKETLDKPVFITEYGCPAYASSMSRDEAEKAQKEYHRGNWECIVYNSARYDGVGNAIGGVVFEWVDEWWKASDASVGMGGDFSPYVQVTQPQWGGPFPDGWAYEEWFGITSQGDGSHSPYLRQLRPAYYYYKEAWNE